MMDDRSIELVTQCLDFHLLHNRMKTFSCANTSHSTHLPFLVLSSLESTAIVAKDRTTLQPTEKPHAYNNAFSLQQVECWR